jgi:hypothetical protein
MTATAERVRTRRARHGVRALITLAAIAAALLVYVVFIEVAGVDVRVPEKFGSRTLVPLEFGAVVGAATIACVAGWLFLTALELFTSKARTIWTVVAVVIYALSLPYMPAFRMVDRLMLFLMHSALAAVLILGMRRTAGPPA